MGVKNTKSWPDKSFVRIQNLKKLQLDNFDFEDAKTPKWCDVRDKNMLIDLLYLYSEVWDDFC